MSGKVKMAILFFIFLCISETIQAEEEIIVEETNIPLNSVSEISIIARNFSDIAGIDIATRFDPGIIEVSGYSLGESLRDCYAFEKIDNQNGSARFLIACPYNISSVKTKILSLDVRALEVGETTLTIHANLSTGDFSMRPAKTYNGRVTAVKTQTTTPQIGGGRSGSETGFSGGAFEVQETTSPTLETTQTPHGTPKPSPEVAETPASKQAPSTVSTTTETPNASSEQTGVSLNITPKTPVPEQTKSEESRWKIPGFETIITVTIIAVFALAGVVRFSRK